MKQLASQANVGPSLCLSQLINMWHDHNESGNSPALTSCFLALSPSSSARSSLLHICFLLSAIFFFFKVTVSARILAKEKENGEGKSPWQNLFF